MPRAQCQPRRCNTDARSRCCASVVVCKPSDRATSASSVDLAFGLLGAVLQGGGTPGENSGESDPEFPSENFDPSTQNSVQSSVFKKWLAERRKSFVLRLLSTSGRGWEVDKDLEEFFADCEGYALLERVMELPDDFYISYFLFWELNRTQDKKRKAIVEDLLKADSRPLLIWLLGHLPDCCMAKEEMVKEEMADVGTSAEAHESMWKWIRDIVDKSCDLIPVCCDIIAKSWKEKEFFAVAWIVDSQLVAKEAQRHIKEADVVEFRGSLRQLMDECWSSIPKQQPEQNQLNQRLFRIYADLYNNSKKFRKYLFMETLIESRPPEWVRKVCWALLNSLLDPSLVSLDSHPCSFLDIWAIVDILNCRPDKVTLEEHAEVLNSVLNSRADIKEVFRHKIKFIVEEAVENGLLCSYHVGV